MMGGKTSKLLCVSMIAMTAIFVLGLAETQLDNAQIDSIIRLISDQVMGSTTQESLNILLCAIFYMVFLLLIFMGYAGETLEITAEREMGPKDVEDLRAAGFSDEAIHDAFQVVGYFNYINRVCDGLGVDHEPFMNE